VSFRQVPLDRGGVMAKEGQWSTVKECVLPILKCMNYNGLSIIVIFRHGHSPQNTSSKGAQEVGFL
jgi:hypothetical protein